MTALNLESTFNVRARQVPAVDGGVAHLVIEGLTTDSEERTQENT